MIAPSSYKTVFPATLNPVAQLAPPLSFGSRPPDPSGCQGGHQARAGPRLLTGFLGLGDRDLSVQILAGEGRLVTTSGSVSSSVEASGQMDRLVTHTKHQTRELEGVLAAAES